MNIRPGLRRGLATTAGTAWLVLVAFAAPASGASAKRTAPRAIPPRPSAAALPAPMPAVAAPVSIGLMAFLDPETGELSGPIGPVVPLADARPAGPQVLPVEMPGGGWMLDLRGAGQEYYVLHVDPFGRRTVSCVQDPRHARRPAPVPVVPAGQER